MPSDCLAVVLYGPEQAALKQVVLVFVLYRHSTVAVIKKVVLVFVLYRSRQL